MSADTNPLHVDLTLNHDPRVLEVEPNELLVNVLRERLGLSSVRVGCDTGQCGTCTVLLDGLPVKSCNVLVGQVHERAVVTLEGVASPGSMHPVQEALVAHHGLQCGYCTPGVVLLAVALLSTEPHPDHASIRHALDGNLCRCTGYQPIVNAIASASLAITE